MAEPSSMRNATTRPFDSNTGLMVIYWSEAVDRGLRLRSTAFRLGARHEHSPFLPPLNLALTHSRIIHSLTSNEGTRVRRSGRSARAKISTYLNLIDFRSPFRAVSHLPDNIVYPTSKSYKISDDPRKEAHFLNKTSMTDVEPTYRARVKRP